MADVGMTRPACRALAAPRKRHHRDVVADRPAVDTLADRGDRPRHLVPKHCRPRDPRVHRAVHDVEIRTADAGVRDLDFNFAGSWPPRLDLEQLYGSISHVARCEHAVASRVWGHGLTMTGEDASVGSDADSSVPAPVSATAVVDLGERPIREPDAGCAEPRVDLLRTPRTYDCGRDAFLGECPGYGQVGHPGVEDCCDFPEPLDQRKVP